MEKLWVVFVYTNSPTEILERDVALTEMQAERKLEAMLERFLSLEVDVYPGKLFHNIEFEGAGIKCLTPPAISVSRVQRLDNFEPLASAIGVCKVIEIAEFKRRKDLEFKRSL